MIRRRSVFWDQPLPQQMTKILTVGALGNDMAAPAAVGVLFAAASNASSETSNRRMASSLCSKPSVLSFMSVCYFGLLASMSCIMGRLKLSACRHAALRSLALSSNLLTSTTGS